MPPAVPFLITGNVRKGPRGGYAEFETTVDQDAGGVTTNLWVDAGTEVAASQTVTILNVTSGNSTTATTDANGDFSYDLVNLNSGEYSDGDSLRIYTDTIDDTRKYDSSDSTEEIHPEVHGRRARVSEPGRLGKEFTEEYPRPVQVMNFNVDSENPSWAATYSSGQIATETVTIRGVEYRKTYTWSSGSLAAETAWVKL